jgi:hypothetical protein
VAVAVAAAAAAAAVAVVAAAVATAAVVYFNVRKVRLSIVAHRGLLVQPL